MEREILFRAWSEELKKHSKPFGFRSSVLDFTDENGLGYIRSLTNEVVEQYAGLKDKNGKKIFEGDKFEDGVSVVFENGSFRTTYHGDNQSGTLLTEKRASLMKVTGTIHDEENE